MKTVTILTLSLGLSILPMAHADDAQQMNMDNMPGMQHDMGSAAPAGSTKQPDTAKMDSMSSMDGMGKMGAMGKNDCSAKMGGMGKMGGMNNMGGKQGALEEQVRALQKRVDFLQAVVEKLLEK
jgi:hypothetical protein